MTTYVLYNPLAGKGIGTIEEKLRRHMPDVDPVMIDMTAVEDYAEFFGGTAAEDQVILCGGDGTLNRFINDTYGMEIPCELLYFAAGSGNDFLKDLGYGGDHPPFPVKEYFRDLPTVTVKGKTYRFLNGVGLGLDGYCCAEVTRAKREGVKKNYITVALRAFLKDYHPANAEITVDGKTYKFEKVWLVPTMKGRYFGGGIPAAPDQDRRGRTVTLLLMHHAPRLLALFRFPSFMKGTHTKYKKIIAILPGSSMSVKFDRPTDMQIDGEMVENVTSYSVSTEGQISADFT